MNYLGKENGKGRGDGVKFKNLNANLMKSPDFYKSMTSPDVPCGHFALGTLSETCFKNPVFDVDVRRQEFTKVS